MHRLVLTMMELEPEKRFQTPAQLLDAIRQARAEASGGRIGTHTSHQTVFVVENDDKLQDVLREKLKKMKYRVLIASDPARALDRYQQNPFNVLLVDIGTVGEDGITAINRVLRKDKTNSMTCHAIAIVSEDQDGVENMLDSDIAKQTSILRRPLRMHDLIAVLDKVAPITLMEDEKE